MVRFACIWSSTSLAMLIFAFTGDAIAADQFQVTVSAGEFDRIDTPTKVVVEVPDEFKDVASLKLTSASGDSLLGQLTQPGILATGGAENSRELHFVVPELASGESVTFTATPMDETSAAESFHWVDEAGKYAELRFGDRPVLRYMYEALDESTPERREETYKVFHHVYGPQGDQIITKGAGGQYTHHRGLFYGFNKVTYGNQRADIWHCRNAHQEHESFESVEAGPVVGRHAGRVDWHGPDKKVFATETREITVYHVPDGNLIEFATRLESEVGPIKLDGDPQHAGFHFRASQEVAEATNKQTFYVRPDGVGKPRETRNWPGNKDQVNLPWNAMSFVVGGERYTCCYLDRPENPKESRFSERDYGRFGSYFEYELDDDHPLELNYRIWLQNGPMTVEQVAAKSNNFVHPPKVTAKGL